MLKINELREAIGRVRGMSEARFARATGWIKDGVCKTPDEALERYCRFNPTMRPEEAVKQMMEALG